VKPETFEANGFALVPGVLSKEACRSMAARVRPDSASGGTRCLLAESWCAGLARRLRDHPLLSRLVPAAHVAVQCTYFEKSPGRNWLVPIHQDLSIPVAERVESPGLGGWSEKEGALFVQPPASLLEALVAIRVHLDDCAAEEGPLRVVPGSHTQGRIAPEAALALRAAATEVSCHAAQGSALVMRPLLLHASSKSTGTGRRRVLHFVFGPQSPGHGLRWHHSV
jgi:hypothetical protein